MSDITTTSFREPANTNASDSTLNDLSKSQSSSSGNSLQSIKSKPKSKTLHRKPARVQKEPDESEDQLPQTGTVYNIWYLKWSGGDKDDAVYSQQKAKYRCVISRDSGYTKADKIPGSYFCLYFARGMCSRGKNCDYLHRLPTLNDKFPQQVDCFGRDKFADYRDDMGGVGSFLRQSRTIYVGRIHQSSNIEEIVARHFQEWGEIDRIRVLNDRGVAFVTFINEANSQFAKEAMAHQSLDSDEILNVRWASEDPNPAARNREKRRIEEEAIQAIKRLLPDDQVKPNKRLKSDYVADDEKNVLDTKLIESNEYSEDAVPIKSGLISQEILSTLSTLKDNVEPASSNSLSNLVPDYDSD